ncbi:UNVERIFIED_CONTAM: hypothetical protein RKD43_000667 [Streptomyces graminofaciens]
MAEPIRVREIGDNEGQRLLRIIRRGSGAAGQRGSRAAGWW